MLLMLLRLLITDTTETTDTTDTTDTTETTETTETTDTNDTTDTTDNTETNDTTDTTDATETTETTETIRVECVRDSFFRCPESAVRTYGLRGARVRSPGPDTTRADSEEPLRSPHLTLYHPLLHCIPIFMVRS